MIQSQSSRALSFFKQVKDAPNPAAFLRGLIGKPLENYESEFLDFKGAARPNDDDVKRAWSKALSGFANSDGGVLIWGIDAPDNAPVALSVVPKLSELNARLHQLLPSVTDPPVQNIEFALYAEGTGSDEGFLVCFIPSSPWRPHRARFSKNEFYIRAGDNHVPASHSILRALFHPESIAVCEIFYQSIFGKKLGETIMLQFWLHNAGMNSARETFILYKIGETDRHPANEFWKNSSSGYSGRAIEASRTIHPGEMIHLFSPAGRVVAINTKASLPRSVCASVAGFPFSSAKLSDNPSGHDNQAPQDCGRCPDHSEVGFLFPPPSSPTI